MSAQSCSPNPLSLFAAWQRLQALGTAPAYIHRSLSHSHSHTRRGGSGCACLDSPGFLYPDFRLHPDKYPNHLFNLVPGAYPEPSSPASRNPSSNHLRMNRKPDPDLKLTLESSSGLCMVPVQDALDSVEDMREHDVPQHWRWAIDNDVRAGYWYTVTAQASRSCWSLERALI